MDLVRVANAGSGSGQDGEETVFVEATEADLNNGGQHGGLQLTTITVAVPASLSPSDLHHVVTGTQVSLPTVPAPQETAVRWKYEQSKHEKQLSHQTGTSLVSFFFIKNRKVA